MMQFLRKLFLKNEFLSLFGNLVSAALGLLGFLLMTRSLSKHAFGIWVLYITLATMIDLLRFGLTRNALIRSISGADSHRKKVFLASSYSIGLKSVIYISLACWVMYFILYRFQISEGFLYFLIYYPFLAFANLSWNNASSYLQAENLFGRLLLLSLINLLPFTVFLAFNWFFFQLSVEYLIIANILANLISSLYCIYKQTDGLTFLKHSSKEAKREIIKFGKYSMGSIIGSSLLRSADTFIIGMSASMGTIGIALYSIPLKLTDLLGIPLRSFAQTAFPKLSAAHAKGDKEEWKTLFVQYTLLTTLAFLPVAIISFFIASWLVFIMGGKTYLDDLPLLIFIFRVFTFYTLILPLDRFTGVALESINKPDANFYKVILMTLTNIVGDVVAVFLFNSLPMVALATIIFTIVGIFSGFYFLKKELNISFLYFLKESWLQLNFRKLIHLLKQ